MKYLDLRLMNNQTNKLIPELRFPEFVNDGEWKEDELHKLGKLIGGLTYTPNDVTEEGLLVLRSSNVQNGQLVLDDCVFVNPKIKGANLIQQEDILICIRNGSKALIGKNAMIPKRIPLATHGAFMTVFRAKNPKFVFQLFQTDAYTNQVNADLGATINSINGTNFLKYKFTIPQNPTEQQKIANCLYSLDELITAHTNKLETLKTYKKGLMQNLFPQEGEKVPKLRFKEFEKDAEWKECVFNDLLNDIIDFRGRTPIKLGMTWGDGNIISLSANNVKNGFIDFNAECNLGSELLYKKWMGKVNLDKGDIVFTMEAPLGNALLVPDSQKYILSQRVVAFKTKAEINNTFLIQLIWNNKFQSEIKKLSTGSTAMGIGQKTLKNIAVRIPENYEEQQKIADTLSSLDNVIKEQSNKIEQLKSHKKGLMQGLFPKVRN